MQIIWRRAATEHLTIPILTGSILRSPVERRPRREFRVRSLLIVLFFLILVAMLAITTVASFERDIVEAGRDLLSHRWFQATLLDAYFGFVTFYVWVAYKERSIRNRILWFVLIMCLGNIAMAIYMLIQLAKLAPSAPVSSILINSNRKLQAGAEL